MKQIEKLAKESGDEFKRPIPPNSNAVMPFNDVWKQAFEAGFRMAREMAALICEQPHTYQQLAANKIRMLGESEVE